MNIFELLNSQFVSQNHYDLLLTQQTAYLSYISQLQNDSKQIGTIWKSLQDAGILELCYEHYKHYAKEHRITDLSPIRQLQQLFNIEIEGQVNYLSDFIDFMGLKDDHKDVYKQLATTIQHYELDYNLNQRKQEELSFQDLYKVICIDLLRLYVESIYSEDGFLNKLTEFGAALDSIWPIPLHLIEQIHSERSIKQIFEAVLYYPDTNDHLMEFKDTMEVTKMFNDLELSLLGAMQKRLLITGVTTETILKFYVNLLRVLQFIDVDCIIFEEVTHPVKEYLLQRNDFLRCIIGILTEENYKATRVLVPQHQDSSDEEFSQEKDLTTVLVSLYGSQDAFIQEYQNMVAEKILSPKEFSLQQEFANIELMKIRFGELQMQTCTIMMKDINESRRIDTNVQSLDKSLSLVHPLFLSKTFWPISYDFKPTFKLPTHLASLFDEYQKRFEKTKTMRTLIWHHDLGSVTLNLSFNNGDFEFRCLPIHATIIGYFNDVENMTITSEYLSQELQMSHEDLKRRMQFWINKGIIKEIKDKREKQKEQDIVHYQAVDEYQEQENDNQLMEEIPEDLFVSSTNFLQSNELIQLISFHLIELLKQTGPLKQEKITQLFKTTFKSEFSMPVTDNNVKEAIKILVQKGKLQGTEFIELK